MAHFRNLLRVRGIQKLYYQPIPPSIWAAAWIPTDNSGEVNKPETMGNVNTYSLVKPMVLLLKCANNGGFQEDYPPLGNQGATGLINANCFSPYNFTNGRITAIRDRLNELPEGKRILLATRYNNGRFFADSYSLAGATYWDSFSNGTTASLWAENIGLTLQNDARLIFGKLKELGANIDYVSFDMEHQGYIKAKFNSSDANTLFDNRVNGITLSSQYTQPFYGSPSFQSIISELPGFSFGDILNGVSNTISNRSYLYWNRAVVSTHCAWINEFLSKPILEHYPNCGISNYNMFNGSTANYSYLVGFHEYFPLGIVGNAPAPTIYPGTQNNVQDFGILASDPTRIVVKSIAVAAGLTTINGFTGDSWNHLLMAVQMIRGVKRENFNLPLRPWIASPDYNEDNLKWEQDSTSLGLWFEKVRHIALTGTEYFHYFNSRDLTGLTINNTHTGRLNDTLEDINARLGGYQNNCITTNKINFNTEFVMSGCQTRDKTYLWRVTPYPNTTIYLDGEELSLDSDGGVWINTSTPTEPNIGT